MVKTNEIEILVAHLVSMGMPREMAKKNLLECDRYFIDKLKDIIEFRCL